MGVVGELPSYWWRLGQPGNQVIQVPLADHSVMGRGFATGNYVGTFRSFP